MFTAALKMFLNSSAVAAVTDAYFNLVTLLLPGNGTNGAQNNTFLDSSSNAFTITRNGNTTQGTFSPFSQTGWSNYFDGSGDYLSNTSTALITNAVTTFTVECWIYLTATPPANANNISALCTLDGQPAGATNYLSFGPLNDGKLYLFWYDGAVKSAAGGTALALNTWYHIACVVNSNAIQFYVNGVAETMSGTTTLTNRAGTQGNFAVGSSSAGQITGYISNFRVTTTAVYTSAFTPPTSALTNITNTKLLTCQSNRFVDNSSNAYALTVNGNPSVQAFSPFAPTAAYSAATVGGSGYFDGSGDYLSVAASANQDFGSSAFTVEFWWYPTADSRQWFYHASTDYWFGIDYKSSGSVMGLWASSNGSSWDLINSDPGGNGVSTGTPRMNAWNHVAVGRSSGTWSMWLNGTRVLNLTGITSAIVSRSAQAKIIGGWAAGSQYTVNGYMNDFRVVIGTDVYGVSNSTITVPTAPLTAVTNTQLLTNFTNAGITDATAKNDLETVGNASISTVQSKFGGSSMFFDGTGDYLSATPKIQSNAVQGGNSTIEMWVYTSNSSSSLKCLVDTRSAQNTDTGFGVYQIANNVVIYGAGVKGNAVGQLTGNAWVHLAVTRANTTNYVFIGGTLYNTFSYGNTLTSSNVTIGSDVAGSNAFTGYIDDLRITNGFARYTANFTPTTTAFPLQ